MSENELKVATREIQEKVEDIKVALNAALSKFTFNNEKFGIVSFSVAPLKKMYDHVALEAAPCRTKCVLLPSGGTECKPDCS